MTIVAEKPCLVKPFLKWAGGKGQLINEIQAHLPHDFSEINTYIEPFIGGGAVFFYITQRYKHIKRFYLFDINDDLVQCYNAIKRDVTSLIHELFRLQDDFLILDKPQRKEFFLEIRKKFNSEKLTCFGIKTAAKLIFLNKTCFNGLYRVNKKGEFNVPFGDYKNPRICMAEKLKTTADILQKAEIICGDFENCLKYVGKKTFIYFDPPYRPISNTSSFTSYCKEKFAQEEQLRLARFCKEKINARGAKFLLSNSDPKNENPKDHFFEVHYKQFHIDRVKASRMINCKASGRGQISELLITNY
ncbi:DNA adenine methylase [Planctomycetota bacterium]